MKKIFTVCALFMLMFIVACGGSKTPGAAALEYIEYIQDGNYSKFVEELYKVPQENVDEKALKQQEAQMASMLEMKGQETIDKKGGIKEAVLVSETLSEDGKTAKVVINQIYGDGSEEENNCDMILDEDGVWRMKLSK